MSDSTTPQCGHAGGHGAANDQFAQQEERIRARAAQIGHQILVLSGKGGVGKSAVATSLAWALALRGHRTGLLDADISGPSSALMTGLRGQSAAGTMGLTPVPVLESLQVLSISFLLENSDQPTIWRGPMRGGVIRQFIADADWGPLDYLVVDLPPGTGDEPLTVAQAFPDADGGVVVTTPQEASVAVCRKAVNFLRAVNQPCLGVIENMSGFVCPHCGKVTEVFRSGGGEEMARDMGVPFLGRIPLMAEAVSLCDEGQPLLGPAAPAALRDALTEIANRIAPERA